MKKILLPLIAFAGIHFTVSAQSVINIQAETTTNPEEWVGTWKVKLRCVESMCENPGKTEPRENSLTADTWTISFNGENGFTLISSNKSIGTMRSVGSKTDAVVFESFTGPANRIVVQRPKNNTITGSRLVARGVNTGACVYRFTVSGGQ